MFSESVAEKCVQKILFSQNTKIHESESIVIVFLGWWSRDCISLSCIDVSDILGYSLSISNYQSQDISARPSNIRSAMKKT